MLTATFLSVGIPGTDPFLYLACLGVAAFPAGEAGACEGPLQTRPCDKLRSSMHGSLLRLGDPPR